MRKILLTLIIAASVSPLFVAAHEVYVLDQATVDAAMATTSQNTFSAYVGNEAEFFFWAFISFVTVLTLFFATIFGFLEKSLGPLMAQLKRFALPLIRITTGVSMLSFGLAGALYGTEIPFERLFGGLSSGMQILFVVSGLAMILGIFSRWIAVLMIALYAYTGYVYGLYVLTYTDHIGAYLALAILGSGEWSLDHYFRTARFSNALSFLRSFTPLALPGLRILFGFGIMFAAVYAKYLHSELALQVVLQYHLTDYFPFEPMFIVLGALIIEFLAGLMLVLGVAIRWTGLFLLFWLTLSLLYFQEAVWPHIILFGLGIAIFFHGYDRLSLEGVLMKKLGNEPIM